MFTAPIWILAVACAGGVVAGVLLRLWVSTQRFSRLNALGVEAFNSLGSMAAARFTETLAGWVSNVLLFVGLAIGLVIAARFLLPV